MYFVILDHSEDGQRILQFKTHYEASDAFGEYHQIAVQHAEYKTIKLRSGDPHDGKLLAAYNHLGLVE